MRKLRVAVLMHEDLVPPDSIEGLSDQQISDWRTEFDVIQALSELGHEVLRCGLPDDPDALRDAIQRHRPHVAFNLLTEFLRVADYDQHAVSYLELLRQPYTGCNPRGMTLARDKALSKKVLAWHGVPVPGFAVFPRGARPRAPRDLTYPLFVKSVNEEASLGISRASIVRTPAALFERVAYFHDEIETDAIAEEFVEGRELYVGVLGNERLTTFPARELFVDGLAAGQPLVATRQVKWNVGYQRRAGVRTDFADLPPSLAKAIARDAKAAYRALHLSGYARLDIRLRPDGSYAVLEANPNPDLTYGEDFAEGAEGAGLEYPELLQRLIRLGRAYPAGWKAV
jgi:D-alanine-D-alanine ligase